MKPAIIIVCGPTASGKSLLAATMAQVAHGVVINADSMQMYADLRIVTARPNAEEEAQVLHALYGVLPGSVRCSAGKWLEMAKREIDHVHAAGGVPIITGGTGLYIKTLLEGISPIPDMLPEIHDQTQALFNQVGASEFHKLLKLRDPKAGEKIRPSDSQRMIRAYDVVEQTGHSLIDWQEVKPEIPYPASWFTVIEIELERKELYERCDDRFLKILQQGALEEVEQLVAKRLPPEMPIMKAVGVPELTGVLEGRLSIEEATIKSQQATRNYAKRQLTWLRNQMPDNRRIPASSLMDLAAVFETAHEILKSVDPEGQNL